MASASWDRKRAAHLYRRAGFGGRPEDLDRAISLGREGAVSYLVDYDGISTADLDAYLGLFGFDLGGYQEGIGDLRGTFITRWWYSRMLHGPRPLQEKMTLFWHNHFATSFVKVEEEQLMYAQNQIFRNLGMGRFGDLLLAVSRDPAMLLYLDNASNIKGAPNENFAREVMELFTMGHGNYTQQDITESAGPTPDGRSMRPTTINSSSTRTSTTRGPSPFSGSGATSTAKTSSRFWPGAPRPPPSSAASSRASSWAAIRRPRSRKASRTSTRPAPATSARSSGRFSSPTTSIRPRMHPT